MLSHEKSFSQFCVPCSRTFRRKGHYEDHIKNCTRQASISERMDITTAQETFYCSPEAMINPPPCSIALPSRFASDLMAAYLPNDDHIVLPFSPLRSQPILEDAEYTSFQSTNDQSLDFESSQDISEFEDSIPSSFQSPRRIDQSVDVESSVLSSSQSSRTNYWRNYK